MQLPSSFLLDPIPDDQKAEVLEALYVLHVSGFFALQERREVETFANQIAGAYEDDGFSVERSTIYNAGKLSVLRLIANEAASLARHIENFGDKNDEREITP